jgi:ribosomal protein L20A (L18A)
MSMFLIFTSLGTMAASDKSAPEMTAQQKLRFQEISLRIDEIKEMDKSQLSKSERKELKKELNSMKKESKALSGGVYLSVTAIIIVILLLILVL